MTAETLEGNSSVTVSLGAGDGTLASSADLTGPMDSPVGVGVGDINGDGRLDVLWTNAGNGMLSVAFGNGDGTFQSPLSTAVNARLASFMTLDDFNRDGILDVALSKRRAGRVAVLLGNGDGTFNRLEYVAGAEARAVAAADLDGDGAADLAVSNTGAGTVSVLLNTGNGTFAAKTDYAMGARPRGVAIGDLDRDGIPDMVTASADSFSVRLGNGDGTFGARIDRVMPDPQNTVVIADMNRDGRPDIVTANRANNASSVLLNRAASFAFTNSTYRISEGPSGSTAVISVRRTGNLSTQMTVNWAINPGTAQSDVDYNGDNNTLTFGVGESLKTFNVSILPDNITEDDETIVLSLSGPTGDSGLARPGIAILTIAANDLPKLQFNRAAYSTGEGVGNRTITVTRSGGFGTVVTVNYATVAGGSATAGVDYTTVSGTLTFDADDTVKTFDVPITNDLFTEGPETINLELSSPGGAVLGPRSTAVLTIDASD